MNDKLFPVFGLLDEEAFSGQITVMDLLNLISQALFVRFFSFKNI